MKKHIVYILRTDRGTLYTGQTNDLEKRLEKHKTGRGAKYLRGFDNFDLVYTEETKDLSMALKREAEIKKMNKKAKEELVVGYQNRDPLLEMGGEIVGFYEREFYCFSNFSSFQVEWRGRVWPTSEHAYQASHFFKTAPDLVEEIYKAKSAHEAFKIAKANANKAPKNWEKIKVGIMEEIVRCKLEQNPYIRHKLLQTGDRKIVEDSPKDDCWGWGPRRDGRNELGKIWMRLRDKIRV